MGNFWYFFIMGVFSVGVVMIFSGLIGLAKRLAGGILCVIFVAISSIILWFAFSIEAYTAGILIWIPIFMAWVSSLLGGILLIVSKSVYKGKIRISSSYQSNENREGNTNQE